MNLHLAPHPVFQVDGHDLTRSLKVAPWDAALGHEEMKTLVGSGEGGFFEKFKKFFD